MILFKQLLKSSAIRTLLVQQHHFSTSLLNASAFQFHVSKFNDIHITSKNLQTYLESNQFNYEKFEAELIASLEKWNKEERTSVWIYHPMSLARVSSIASKYGFKYHHAENDEAAIFKWLPDDRESKIPLFATHQMGVAGVVYRPDTNQLLAIKDKIMLKDVWKFPGGAGTTVLLLFYEDFLYLNLN